ncbi:hypothetical protein GCM10007103_24720 [Salinimicrobium marinum]|uniref:DUF3347 domain-containing protein n=1 Tax=Salinimicrobium marinum TaxID=680283 RepID=A0A918W113_9FLAO|nr:DUF3347 domain-containing protein [Salinimicrobium marinum]GHA42637.1 hypothetical protein GCM10007103_24720 [Salinimicrobium marinum]
MKKVKLVAVAVMGMLTLVSCKENQTEGTDQPPMQNDTRMPEEGHDDHMSNHDGNLDDGQQMGSLEFEDEKIASVYEHYQHIKSALVNTNSEEAQKGGEMLVSSLEEAEANEEVLSSARTIAGSSDINVQRTAFLELSSGVEQMVSGALASGEIYKQYCPMAFEGNGGSWLSSSEEIRNPYYGDKMLKCGSVRETIQ